MEFGKKRREILDYLQEFEDVFSKKSFDALPEQKVWDHAIELEPGSKPSNCKVYPLSRHVPAGEAPDGTHLAIYCKSPMASPVFSIKKKDRALWLVQDY